jgi:hypothetical protein
MIVDPEPGRYVTLPPSAFRMRGGQHGPPTEDGAHAPPPLTPPCLSE